MPVTVSTTQPLETRVPPLPPLGDAVPPHPHLADDPRPPLLAGRGHVTPGVKVVAGRGQGHPVLLLVPSLHLGMNGVLHLHQQPSLAAHMARLVWKSWMKATKDIKC
uniref:Uncharacterized protein n=1 Tax=Cacopsylla melanoneura TaxID=428564 RepID=A0A8D8PQW9_9HEMI